jgi:hypothetical protein
MLEKVNFRPEDYRADIARILELAGGGDRPMPLVKNGRGSAESCEQVRSLENRAGGVLSGLYLYLGCWEAAHAAADSVEDPNGYFWHAIVHRQEPDPGNAAYWFRKTGKHPIFDTLAGEARGIGYVGDSPGHPTAREWDPIGFVEFCESARLHPGSIEEQLAAQVQLVEWQLLFDYCARSQSY